MGAKLQCTFSMSFANSIYNIKKDDRRFFPNSSVILFMFIEVSLPDGKTVVDEARVFVNVMEADLREAEGAAYEYHKKYADIQINIDGSERWEYTVDGSPEGTFDEASDFGLKKAHADT